MSTYQEMVARYQILKHTELPEEYKEAYRKDGINPDEVWSLVWSFFDKEAAEATLEEECKRAFPNETFKLVDAGQTTYIERHVW